MNNILKNILLGAEKIAVAVSPEAAKVDAAARTIISASTGQEKGAAIYQTALASLTLLETDLGMQFADEPDFQAGLSQAKAGFTLMAKAIQHRTP